MGNDDDQEKERAAALDAILKANKHCDDLDEIGRSYVRGSDLARATSKVAEFMIRKFPAGAPGAADMIRRTRESWNAFNGAVDIIKAQHRELPIQTWILGTATTTTVTVTQTFYFSAPSPDTMREFKQVEAEYHRHIDLDRLMESALWDLKRLKLDVASGPRRSPARVLEEAYAAIRVPPVAGGFPPALLALRGAIDDAIAEMVRRRPVQEEAGKGAKRIQAIGAQSAKEAVSPEFFERLEQDYRSLHDRLSGEGKGGVADAVDVVRRFHDGMMFLCALLGALNEARLR